MGHTCSLKISVHGQDWRTRKLRSHNQSDEANGDYSALHSLGGSCWGNILWKLLEFSLDKLINIFMTSATAVPYCVHLFKWPRVTLLMLNKHHSHGAGLCIIDNPGLHASGVCLLTAFVKSANHFIRSYKTTSQA